MFPATPQKPRKTLADQLAIAVAPALIMVLVGSLVFFLALLLYRNGYPMHLYWTLGWFVLGSVLVTRIAIEGGSDRSALFALPLGGVTALWLIRYVDPPFGGVALLGVIWWCTRKLVLDCTLIDEDEDATGEGLLDSAGIREEPAAEDAARPHRRPKKLVFWNYAIKAEREKAIAAQKAETLNGPSRKPAGRPPGSWMIYFSLGALPLFGLGDALLPKSDPARRYAGFGLVGLYVAAALGLLLITSFLGFRRYLRQRRLRMPLEIAASWVFSGSGAALAVLAFCILLPRPQAIYSLPALAERLGARSLREAPWKISHQSAPEDHPDGKTGGEKPGKNDPGDSANGKQADGKTPPNQGQPGGQQTDHGTPSGPKLNDLMAPKYNPVWLKRLVNALFALAALLLLIRYGGRLWAALLGLWQDLLGMFRPRSEPIRPKTPVKTAQPRPFTAFKNPFSRDGISRLTPSELVRYTFEAMEAWALTQNQGRRTEETPLEFAIRLQGSMPEVASQVHDLGCQYTRVAYSGRDPESDSVAGFSALWGYMSSQMALTRE